MESLSEFFNGSSKSLRLSKIGCFVGSLIKWVLILFVAVTLIGIGQFAQYNHSYNDYRENAISEWVDGNDKRQAIATDYINSCLKSATTTDTELPIEKPVMLYGCAKEINAQELDNYIENMNIIHSLAWPLSLLNK